MLYSIWVASCGVDAAVCIVLCVSFTYVKGFLSMMNELNDIAGQHEMIAENLVTQIISDLTQLILSLRQDRKRVSPALW